MFYLDGTNLISKAYSKFGIYLDKALKYNVSPLNLQLKSEMIIMYIKFYDPSILHFFRISTRRFGPNNTNMKTTL